MGVQSKTEQYAIKQLPGLPDNLRKDTTAFRAHFQSLSQNTHEVIVTTSSVVLIWDYTTTISSPVPTTVRLPESLKSSEKLPLAATVPNGTSSAAKDGGLVVVCPSSGKIWYWEALDTATTYKVYTRTLKIRDGLIKLMSGEVVEKLLRVEHGGYVLVLSSGRLAYLSLQDRNSSPAVNVSLLSNEPQSNAGWFGSLRATLGGGWRNTVAGVHTRPRHNRFETVALTQEGVLKVWDVTYDGSATLKDQYDLSDDLRDAFSDVGLIDKNAKTPITVIDFALSNKKSSALTKAEGPFSLETVILVAISDSGASNFLLAHVSIGGTQVEITRFTPIQVFKGPANVTPSNFDLIVPDPGHSAFIVMPNAVIIVSLEKIYDDARDSLSNSVFQDIIYFQFTLGAEIISSSPEFYTHAKSDASGLLLFTKNSGAVRIIAERPSRDAKRQSIKPKAKIEQEVFFGKYAQPILDFGQSGSFNFTQRDVEEAALELSHEILTSSNPNIPDSLSSMENQIYWRTQQLRRLIDFVLAKYSPISRATKWRLLWDAEKLEAAHKLWKVYETWLGRREDDEKILFPLFVTAIPDRSLPDASQGEVDPVRHWFAHDVDRISRLIFKMEYVILNEHRLQAGKWELLVQYISEAQDVIKALLNTAYEFREANLKTYGLRDEKIEDGVLLDIEDYAGLPEPWTATKNICTRLEGFVAATTTLLVEISEEASDPATKVDVELLAYLRKHQWMLVFISCLAHNERVRWLQARPEEEERANGARMYQAFRDELRPDMLLGLAELGRAFDGMQIAEKMHDMDGLVKLCIAEIEYLNDPDERMRLSSKEQAHNERQKDQLYKQVEKYFTEFGEAFAKAFFTAQVDNGRLADLLQLEFGKQKELTKFLRANPQHWRLAWINEVTREKDLRRAGETLLKIAVEREPNIWVKNAEVGMAKLLFKAANEPAPRRGGTSKKRSQIAATGDEGADSEKQDGLEDYINTTVPTELERQRILNEAQEALLVHMRPCFQLGVDKNGAIDCAMTDFGKYAVRDRPALETLLRQGFTQLNDQKTMAPELLIDVLTLMDAKPSANESRSIHNKMFVWAVKVLYASGYLEGRDAAKGEGLRGLIWKRCFVRDDWVKVHHTKGKRDREVAKKLRETLLFETLKQGALESESFYPPFHSLWLGW
jgi:nuclear pore complex protein Nup133